MQHESYHLVTSACVAGSDISMSANGLNGLNCKLPGTFTRIRPAIQPTPCPTTSVGVILCGGLYHTACETITGQRSNVVRLGINGLSGLRSSHLRNRRKSGIGSNYH